MMQILRPPQFLRLLRKEVLNYSVYHKYRELKSVLAQHGPVSFVPRVEFSAKIENGVITSVELDALEDIEDVAYDLDVTFNDSVRDMLYPAQNDGIIGKINKCETIEEVCRIAQKHGAADMKGVVQAILVSYDIEHMRLAANRVAIEQMSVNNLPKEFEWLLDRICDSKATLDAEELTCCLLYLNKLGFSMRHDRMQEILTECLNRINNEEVPFNLSALSRFTVAMSSMQGDLYLYLVCKDTLPRLLRMLDETESSEELRLISICLNHLPKLVTDDILSRYQVKVREFLVKGIINKDTVRCILKAVNFLNYPQWSQKNMKLIRELSLILRDKISTFQTRELVALLKTVQSHLEPASLIPAITEQSKTLIKMSPSAELLACAVLYSLPQQRVELTEVAKDIVFSTAEFSPSTLPSLFKALRLLKISNIAIIDAYWDRVLQALKGNSEERENYRIARICHRYMHFNNNLGGTYRHRQFEAYVSQLLMEELQTGLSSMMPMRFAKLSSFILAYGYEGPGVFPNFIINTLERVVEQLSIFDCLQISRGLQIALEMRFKHFIPKELGVQLVRFENIFNACAERHIVKDNLTLYELNSIVRTFNNRKYSKRSSLYRKIIEKYATIKEPLDSRLIRDITFNLNASGYRIESICDQILDYIHKNRDHVIGDTVEKVIYCCFNLGYVPVNEAPFHSAVEIIHRDFDYMSGLSIVQACLALSFFKLLPESLINRVFNIDFIKRLEDEIKMCYSKATYPERVLNQVMQLNRSVCLDYPEANVPWFQQNYIEAQLSKQPKHETQFHMDVKQFLTTLVKDSNLIATNYVTPYGYRIDFVVFCDKDQNFLPPPPAPETAMPQLNTFNLASQNFFDYIRIAIVLPKIESFCENKSNCFRGAEYLKQRHLEMLGYKVLHINYSEWNSMYMSVPNAKLNYLKSLLQFE